MKTAPSLNELRRALPHELLQDLTRTFGPSLADRILQAFRSVRPSSFRVNTLKVHDDNTILHALRQEGFRPHPFPGIPHAYTLDTDRSAGLLKTRACQEGLIYLQSLSSMLPALLLEPQPHEHILDLCASPGGKTSQIVALMRGTGSVTAVEPHPIRRQRLEHNLRLLGCASVVEVVDASGVSFATAHPESFDRVLVDAPCSGEGRIAAHDRRTFAAWSSRLVRRSADLQVRLLTAAFRAVKPGGLVVYSTCTLNTRENEETCGRALASPEGRDISVEPVPDRIVRLCRALPALPSPTPDLSKAVRILPSDTFEGFFLCAFRKHP